MIFDTNFLTHLTEAQAFGLVLIWFFGGAVILPVSLWIRHWFMAAVTGVILFVGEWVIVTFGRGGLALDMVDTFVHGVSRLGGVLFFIGLAVLYASLRQKGNKEKMDTWFTGWTVLASFSVIIGDLVARMFNIGMIDVIGDVVFILVASLVYVCGALWKIEFELPFIFKGYRNGEGL